MPAHTSLDPVLLAELKDLLADNFNELIERYTVDSAHRFSLLVTAVPEKDYKTIYYEAHGIKGSSRNMGATKLAEICGQLEAQGHAEDGAGLENLLSEASAEFEVVCGILAGERT